MYEKKDVVIITSFSTYEPRADYIKEFFKSLGKTVIVISTDFDHREKKTRAIKNNKNIYVHTVPYKKNLTFTRLYSHYCFSKDAIRLVSKYNPDYLYVLIPANTLVKCASLYKIQHQCKLIIDVIDLWPESLPIKTAKKRGPFYFWRQLRDKFMVNADLIITECDLYSYKLQLDHYYIPYFTVYWPQKSYPYQSIGPVDNETLHFLYLGSINNIIDVKLISDILRKIGADRSVFLHIVGVGENSGNFMKILDDGNIPYHYYGSCYKHEFLQEVSARCHMGINIMKHGVEVGLTMKSVSYFELGIPVINNLKGDTWQLIEKYNAGINIENKNDLVNLTDLEQMRINARRLFKDQFSEDAVKKQLNRAFYDMT